MFHVRWVGLRGGYTETGDLKKVVALTRSLRGKKKSINETSFLRSHSISEGGKDANCF